jgi:hypothetical protein
MFKSNFKTAFRNLMKDKMRGWLQNYHYRAALSLRIFLAAGAGALAITVAVVGFQAVRAAVVNPVKSLRSE